MTTFTTPDLKRFNHLFSEIDTVYHEAALRMGLSDSAMLILYTICNAGEECMLSQVYTLSGVKKQTINSALRKLEANGIVYLTVQEGKKKKLCLTDKGLELAQNTVAHLMQIENGIYDSWTPKEREIYLELTQRYLTALKQQIKDL